MTSKLNAHRQLYARLITSGLDTQTLEHAFATVPREIFMSKGPWHIRTAGGYIKTPTDDPELLYQDVLVALKMDTGINNGMPSLHARNIDALKIKPAETIAQIGAGTGYYSAILAEVTGANGSVTAFEIDPDLATAAATHLARWTNVSVQGDATVDAALPAADVIYINAGVTGPLPGWLDALTPGGRMLLPMTDHQWNGGMLLLRKASAPFFNARFISPVSFIPCVGARDKATAERLTIAYRDGSAQTARTLVQNNSPDASCVFAGAGWWLSRLSVESLANR